MSQARHSLACEGLRGKKCICGLSALGAKFEALDAAYQVLVRRNVALEALLVEAREVVRGYVDCIPDPTGARALLAKLSAREGKP